MCSARDNAALPTLGFPIRASAGHWLFSASPRLIAAVHALHRLLVPRHPPCALTILTVIAESRRARFRRRNRRFLQGKRCQALALIPNTLATVQFSRSVKRRNSPHDGPGPSPANRRRRAGLSKLNSMRWNPQADSIGRNLTVTQRRFHRCRYRFLPTEFASGKFGRFGRHS